MYGCFHKLAVYFSGEPYYLVSILGPLIFENSHWCVCVCVCWFLCTLIQRSVQHLQYLVFAEVGRLWLALRALPLGSSRHVIWRP